MKSVLPKQHNNMSKKFPMFRDEHTGKLIQLHFDPTQPIINHKVVKVEEEVEQNGKVVKVQKTKIIAQKNHRSGGLKWQLFNHGVETLMEIESRAVDELIDERDSQKSAENKTK